MNDDRSTNPNSTIRVLAGIAGACVAVIAIVVLVYALTMPPSPEEAAESYIEDHYDAVAEAIVQAVFPDNPLTAEVIAEVAESIAERVIPYRCDENKDYRATVGIRCDLSFSLDKPLELRIYAPFQVILATTDRDFLGRTTPVVQGCESHNPRDVRQRGQPGQANGDRNQGRRRQGNPRRPRIKNPTAPGQGRKGVPRPACIFNCILARIYYNYLSVHF